MRPQDIADSIFHFFFTQQPDVNGYVKLNEHLRTLGVTEPETILKAYHYLAEWFYLYPEPPDFRFADTPKRDRQTGARIIAPRMTLDNEAFHIKVTVAGTKERADRIRAQHEAEFIAKQNSTFDDVMQLAKEGAEAAKLSAQAAVDAVDGSRDQSRWTNWIAIGSTTITLAALLWTIYHDEYGDKPVVPQVLPVLYIPPERPCAAIPSSHPSPGDSSAATKPDSLRVDSAKY